MFQLRKFPGRPTRGSERRIPDIDSKTQADGHGEETIFFESGKDLVVICGKPAADRFHHVEAKNCGWFLNTPPPPEGLKDYPAQPEILCCGWIIGRVLKKPQICGIQRRQRGWDIGNRQEGVYDQRELWLGRGLPINAIANRSTELPECPILRFYSELGTENRRQRHPN